MIRFPLDQSGQRISQPARRLSEVDIRHPEGINRMSYDVLPSDVFAGALSAPGLRKPLAPPERGALSAQASWVSEGGALSEGRSSSMLGAGAPGRPTSASVGVAVTVTSSPSITKRTSMAAARATRPA